MKDIVPWCDQGFFATRASIASSVKLSGSEFKAWLCRIRGHPKIFDYTSENSSRKALWSGVGSILIVSTSKRFQGPGRWVRSHNGWGRVLQCYVRLWSKHSDESRQPQLTCTAAIEDGHVRTTCNTNFMGTTYQSRSSTRSRVWSQSAEWWYTMASHTSDQVVWTAKIDLQKLTFIGNQVARPGPSASLKMVTWLAWIGFQIWGHTYKTRPTCSLITIRKKSFRLKKPILTQVWDSHSS